MSGRNPFATLMATVTGGSMFEPSTLANGSSPESISNKQKANEYMSDLSEISSKSPTKVSGLIQNEVPPTVVKQGWHVLEEILETPKSAIFISPGEESSPIGLDIKRLRDFKSMWMI